MVGRRGLRAAGNDEGWSSTPSLDEVGIRGARRERGMGEGRLGSFLGIVEAWSGGRGSCVSADSDVVEVLEEPDEVLVRRDRIERTTGGFPSDGGLAAL